MAIIKKSEEDDRRQGCALWEGTLTLLAGTHWDQPLWKTVSFLG